MKLTKEELIKRGWEESGNREYRKTYIPNSVILINLETEQGKAITFRHDYGKLELRFMISKFSGVLDLEIFCINFFIGQSEK